MAKPETAAPAALKALQIVTIDGAVFLGYLTESGNKITLKDSLRLGEVSTVTKQNLIEYITASTTGKLSKDIIIRGAGATFSESDLPDDLALEYQVLLLKLEQARKLAVPELEAKKFAELAR